MKPFARMKPFASRPQYNEPNMAIKERLIEAMARRARTATRMSFAAADQQHRFGGDPNEPFRHAAEEQTPEAATAVRANHDKFGGPTLGFLLDYVVDAIGDFDNRNQRRLGVHAESAGRRRGIV
jgi:hypothetical protein